MEKDTKADVTTLPSNNIISDIKENSNKLNTGKNASLENDTESFTLLRFSDEILDDIPIYINKTIKNRSITLQNVSVFISKTIIINTRIRTNGKFSYNVFVENCTIKDSWFDIDSAKNVSIQNSQFLLQNVSEYQVTEYILTVNNIESLYIYNTFFGNLSPEENDTEELRGATSLAIKLNYITLAEISNCTFTGIRSDESDGVALFVKSTHLKLASSNFHKNLAKYNIIYATDRVNISTINCSFISNHAGAVLFMEHLSSISNEFCIFEDNIVREHGEVVSIKAHSIMNNYQCLFQHNFGTVIYMRYNSQILNQEVII